MDIVKTINNIYPCLGDDISKELFDARLEYLIYQDEYRFLDIVKNHYEDFYPIKRWDEFIEEKGRNIPVIIFGAGLDGKYTYSLLKKFRSNLNIVAFADNNKNLWGKVIDNTPIYSLEKINLLYPDAVILISSRKYVDKMYEQLLCGGFNRENIWYPQYRRFCAFYGKQYFDLPYLYKEDEEVFVDAGALDGSTSLQFAQWCDYKYKEIYTFEPDPASKERCLKNIKDWNLDRINFIAKGTYDKEDRLSFFATGDGGAAIDNSGKDFIEVTSIDKILEGKKATFIKMDVEGSELASLRGAKKTILKYRPKLAISVYHKPEDIIEIPNYILSLVPDYKLYIRHYSTFLWETVLYAI